MTDKIKILIVEDEALTAMCLQQDMKNLGANVLKPVSKGEIAVEVALQEKPDLILMDISLAGSLNGIETARLILKEIQPLVVFMTGYTADEIKTQTTDLPGVAFLEKPVSSINIAPHLEKLQSK